MATKIRVTGIGGVFLRADDPAAQADWYQRHLGIEPEWEHGTAFRWRKPDNPTEEGVTIWSQVPANSPYFGEPEQKVMMNYRVDNLDLLLEALRAEGVWIDDKREESEYGRFAWIKDAEGNRVELWQPPATAPKA